MYLAQFEDLNKKITDVHILREFRLDTQILVQRMTRASSQNAHSLQVERESLSLLQGCKIRCS